MCTLLTTSQQKSMNLQILIFYWKFVAYLAFSFFQKNWKLVCVFLSNTIIIFLSVLILFHENKLSIYDFSPILNNFLLDNLYAVCYWKENIHIDKLICCQILMYKRFPAKFPIYYPILPLKHYNWIYCINTQGFYWIVNIVRCSVPFWNRQLLLY